MSSQVTASSPAPDVAAARHQELTASEFRGIVGRFASGVTVITCRDGEELLGATASAFSSLSADPPMVLVCLNRSSRTANAIERTGRFAVNVLSETQHQVASTFAGKSDRQFSGIVHSLDIAGQPVLAGAHASLSCEVESIAEGGTHMVFLSFVVAASPGSGRPLPYHGGRFGTLTPRDEQLTWGTPSLLDAHARFGIL